MNAPSTLTGPVSGILDGAADLIAARGKSGGTYGTDDGPVCALGAVRWATFGVLFPDPATTPRNLWAHYFSAQNWLRVTIGLLIARWNDTHDTPTVVTGLRQAAAKARKAGA